MYMMKTTILTGAFMLCSIALFSGCKDQHSGAIPNETILQAFNNKYPGINRVSWETKSEYKVAEFKNGANETEAWFDLQGNWVMTETDLPFNQLPQPVRTSFSNSEYADWKVEDVDKLERIQMATLYIIEVEKGETEADLHYSEDGLLVEVIIDREGQGDSYQPAVMPEAIQSFLTEQFPGYTLLDFDREKTGYEVDIKTDGIHKEIMFNASFEWLFTKWEIHRSQLPESVTNALKNSEYGSYGIDDIDVIEKPAGLFYVIELEQGNKEVTVTFDAEGKLIR